MSIYTKTGDRGETSLANMQRVSKASVRLQTYGTADELNAWVGMLRARCQLFDCLQQTCIGDATMADMLCWIQNRLFNVGSALSLAKGEWITATDVAQIERWIDGMQAALPPLRSFILPAGNETICTAHLCRTVTRRLERLVVELIDTQTATTQEEELLQFINRLSDYFFVLARYMGHLSGVADEAWIASREI